MVEETLTSWDNVRDKIKVCVINQEWNEEKLKHMPHKKFLDLAVTFYVELYHVSDRCARVEVFYSLMEQWGVDESVLWKEAFSNLMMTEFTIRDMEEVVFEILGLKKEDAVAKGYQYVMTNDMSYYGAAGLLRTDLLEKFSEERGNFYILPSSLHELILMPDKGEFSPKELQEMVKEINETQVEQQERLADSVYYFNREKQKVEKLYVEQ